MHEAQELREGGITQPILLLERLPPEEWDEVLRQGFHLCVSTFEEASALDALAAQLGTTAHVHVVVDTGMGRIGFPEHTGTRRWPAHCSHCGMSRARASRHICHLADDDEVFTRGQSPASQSASRSPGTRT